MSNTEIILSIVKIFVILVAAFAVVRLVKFFLTKFLRRFIKSLLIGEVKPKITEEREKTIIRVVISMVRIIVWVVAILTILPELGINIGPLLAGLGVAGLALGLGARNLIQDYLSGIFILLEDHYRVGEEIEISGVKGKVKDFNLRRTVIIDGENNLYYIPNSQVKQAANFSRKK